MTPTPRTTEAWNGLPWNNSDKALEALRDFAEKLETELAEAQEERDMFRTELAISTARLRCEVHPDDNGILAEGEVLPSQLKAERDSALAKVKELQAEVERLKIEASKAGLGWKSAQDTQAVCDSLRARLAELESVGLVSGVSPAQLIIALSQQRDAAEARLSEAKEVIREAMRLTEFRAGSAYFILERFLKGGDETCVGTAQLSNAAGTFKPEPAAEPRLAKHQPCGCVICTCEDEVQCHGCGAKNCGTHKPGEIPNPVFEQEGGMQKCGPAYCEACGWIEADPMELFLKQEDSK